MTILQAIRYLPGPPPSLQILDQLLLPHQTSFFDITSSEDGWNAIKSMQTRGAPAIAIVAALSLTIELAHHPTIHTYTPDAARLYIHEKLAYLITSRPTAVNLEDAAKKLGRVADAAVPAARTGWDVCKAYTEAAAQMLQDDVTDNEAIGINGAAWIIQNTPRLADKPANVITHCNTGSLATAGYGTALGVIRSLKMLEKLKHAYCTETRPYNQGSRLTAYELLHDDIPCTLITDSMAAALMRKYMNHADDKIDVIVVGADRVVANGDTANKIGTYSLAVLAKFHGVKFLVAAPRTSIDLTKETGAEIKIEHRPASEVTLVKGPIWDGDKVIPQTATVSIAPTDCIPWNPAFDVTPASLIDGIVTEKGVVEKDESGTFPLRKFFDDINNLVI